ncbi:NYN domain-containing protein [Arthrobacter sp. NPDC092385]|uniref:NYN domain-containing protein n=1 Tax=Arthrobacter sp. NPDC092385 TaxID=3363943 RepID=UPI0038084AAF
MWIEGMRLSAVKKGLAKDIYEAMNKKISDPSWTYDFGQLYKCICPDTAQIGRSSLFGSLPPDNDSLWELAKKEGFEVFTFARNAANKEKQVDVAIATQILSDSFQYMKPGDKVVLVSGDRDYLPVIENLKDRNFETVVTFWEHATGKELKTAPVSFSPLDPLFDHLTRK